MKSKPIKKNIFWYLSLFGFLISTFFFFLAFDVDLPHYDDCYDFICLFSSVFAAYFSILDFAVKGVLLFISSGFRRQQNGLCIYFYFDVVSQCGITSCNW
jgi:hypothetical protein